MEKNFGSCTHHQHSLRQLPKDSSSFPLDLGPQNAVPDYMRPYANTVSTNETLPVFPFPGLPHSRASQPNEPLGWFYCLSRSHQAFKEKNPACPYQNCGDAITPNPGSGGAQRRFLVFDHSGDQTTLIFSSGPSGIGTPVRCPTSWMPKTPGAYVLNSEEPGTKIDTVHQFGPNLTDVFTENHGDDKSEMREDTEELNALLYSDDDDNYSENDEETSTGHSPSTMTAYDKQEWFEESVEEVASSAEQTKRRKLFDGGYDVPSLMDTASSVKTHRCYADDAESSCGIEENQGLGELGFLPGNKSLRKESIHETVSILRSIIPGGKGKDAIVVLNEAIHYLKSLKRKAMALGLDAL